MRHIQLLLLVLILSTAAQAQFIKRGSSMIKLTASSPTLSPHGIPEPGAGSGLYRSGDYNPTALFFNANYSVAILDGVLVGGSARLNATFGESGLSTYSVAPYARAYLYYTGPLSVFGELSTSLFHDSNDLHAFNNVAASVGTSVPLSGGLQLSPMVTYYVREGSNEIGLSAGLELILGGEEEEDEPVGTFKRGDLMFGGQVASFHKSEDRSRINFQVGGHYFVCDRLAAGALLGFAQTRTDYSSNGYGGDISSVNREFHLAAGARYYLTDERRLIWYTEAGAGRVWIGDGESNGNGGRNGDGDGYDYEDEYNPNYTYLTAGGGAQYFLRKDVALEAGPQIRYILSDNSLVPGINFGVRVVM